MKPDGAEPTMPAFYIFGFNGGETAPLVEGKRTRSATVWFNRCRDAAEAVGVTTWLIGERSHWGSPNVGALRSRVGSADDFRYMLRLHATANRAVFRAHPPLLVWAPGVSTYIQEMVEDYGLVETAEPVMRERGGVLWREFRSGSGAPWLATLHPTGAWMRREERRQINERLEELAAVARSAIST